MQAEWTAYLSIEAASLLYTAMDIPNNDISIHYYGQSYFTIILFS